MIHLPASARVYLCLSACDMRKSFDSLHALVPEWVSGETGLGTSNLTKETRRKKTRVSQKTTDLIGS